MTQHDDDGRRPRLLDLFCCQGGASAGYVAAGFDVVGVDLDPQPRYPYEFVQADALDYLVQHGHEFDAIHASPPCQGYSLTQRIQRNAHPMLIDKVRDLARWTGRPYVIENVRAARWAMLDPVELCGCVFGLHTYRPRLFESSFPISVRPCAPHASETVKMGRPLRDGDWYHAVGNFSNVSYVRADLGVPWMNRDGIRECVPPAYTEHVGRALLAHLAVAERAA
jgi:DNA (cytosine-5)-methyltransferase 1